MSEAAFHKSALEHCTTSNGDACFYPLDGRDLSTISDDELVWAHAASSKLDFNVSRVAKTAVVKVGFDIAQREAAAMKYVAEHADGRVRLPYIHRNFVTDGRSYLVMDYMDRESLGRTPWTDRDDEQCKIILEQVKDAVLTLRTLTRQAPGPAGSGTPVGGLFSIYGANRNF